MRAWLPVVVLLGLMSPVFAQTTNTSSIEEPAPPALLLADRVFVEDGNRLIAEGNVEALYEDTRLNADRIIYDQTAGTLLIEGQVRITDPNGNIFLADSAEVDAELKNGLLRGARVVLDEQLQLASLEARRVDGRYTQMSKVAVTSCQVCGRDQVPLWQIRARRVIHDEVEKQIYFDEATFHIHKIPVFYAPRLRIPDPSLKRARGFLTPSIRSSSLLGVGIKLPYFVPLGDHQDLTFTPYLSPITRTLETRYRRAFRYGDIEINSAVSQDDLTSDNWRGYVFGTGLFRLPRDFKLKFDFQKTTDDAYLDTYGYSGSDRLKSSIEISRTRLDEYLSAGVIRYESLRVSEDDDTQPALIFDVEYEKRLHPKALGGEIRLGFNAHHHYRTSTLDVDGSDDDTLVDGRDMTRISTEMSWHRRWTLAGGLRAGVSTYLWADRYMVAEDATSLSDAQQITPAAAVELRWPWRKTGADGARYLIEPVAQAAWVGGKNLNVAIDESTRVEFDEGNLLALSRFPAQDRRERGRITAIGVRWLRDTSVGWSAGLTMGKIFREDEDDVFSRSSGLAGTSSDLLVSGFVRHSDGLMFGARGLINEDGSGLNKAELRGTWESDRIDLSASYILLVEDALEERDAAQSEWSFDGEYQFNPSWAGSSYLRYDVADDRLAKAGLGLTYSTECVGVNFSVSRRFASSANVEPSTDFGLTVALKGFSTGGSAKEYRRTCSSF